MSETPSNPPPSRTELAAQPLPRSPELMARDDTGLLVVDVQQKLMPLIPGAARIVWNLRRLIDAARLLGLPVAATEQYPQGLGGTVPELAGLLGEIPTKTAFSCGACGPVFADFEQRGVYKLLVRAADGVRSVGGRTASVCARRCGGFKA
jgi:hypothetical protein